ncbi:hypothetical protein [Streptomyces sp. NPDC097619]|uniref:hypothetical protein n=1 Tax=Streptomyces sp. NPDC097619 TaxID=3157228 RepID=UPI003325DB28
MSHDDGYGGYGEEPGRVGGSGQTRTRLPEPAETHGTPRRPARTSRGLVTVVGIVVLLVAAIAFANQGGDAPSDDRGGDPAPRARSTAATGTAPVEGSEAGIPSGFAHDEQGAQSAATNYAVALASAEIVQPAARADVLRRIFVPDVVAELQARLDDAYGKPFLDKAGLDASGRAKAGMTYVSRTVPVGTKTTRFDSGTATVEVWCTGVFGTAGVGSTNPVSSDWFTMTLTLRWVGDDWKVESFATKDGPAPVHTDRTASSADDISKAVGEFGGFTYAR